MRLEKIVLNGFKSFADKTEFHFDKPITAIVGPNGCGKSNVVDAVKWVLGEQSTKSLRSSQMADVIFSGSSTRKGLSTAEVTLVFSGTRGILPIEADEVEISRRIFRTGESEYRINGKHCRLKDIKELLMDTGIGTRAYCIIEQGQVERLLMASKMERRAIFEEAAGVSKYKAHKNEASRKLDHTEQNLLRLADIVGEIEKRLRSVKLAAGKARNYLTYSERLKELQASYSLSEFDRYRKSLTEKRNALEIIQEQFASTAADIGRRETQLSTLGNEIIETENEINKSDNTLVTIQGRIEQNLQKIDFARSRISELEERKKNAIERIREFSDSQKTLERELHESKQQSESSRQVIDEKKSIVAEVESQIKAISSEIASLEADLEDEKSGIIDIVRRTAQLHNELQSMSTHRDNLSNQKSRLHSRAESARIELEELLAEKAQHQARLNDIEKVLEELNDSLESKKNEAVQAEEKVREFSKRLNHNKEVRSALKSELSVLTDMENRREGLKAGVRTLLKQKSSQGEFAYVGAMLADVIRADVSHAGAVEAALEGRADSLIVKDSQKLLDNCEDLAKLSGRVDFICMDRLQPFRDTLDLSQYESVKGRLVEFVRFEDTYAPLVWQLLGKVLIVDTIKNAFELAKTLGSSYSFVTLQGEYLDADGCVRLGSVGKSVGLISRKSRLRQLEETLTGVNNTIDELESELEKTAQTAEHLAKLQKDLRTAVYEANTEKMQVGSKLDVFEKDVKRLSEEQPLLSSEIQVIEEEIATSVQKEYDSKQKLQELEAVNEERSTRIEELESQIEEKSEYESVLQQRLTEEKVALGQAGEQIRALTQRIEALKGQVSSNQKSLESARVEIEQSDEQMQVASRDVLTCEASVSELFIQKEQRQSKSQELHKRVEGLLEQQHTLETQLKEIRTSKESVEEQLQNARVEIGQIEVKQQGLIERVQDELGIDLAQAYEDYEKEEMDWEAVRAEISELRSKIERLGNVNLDAIGELEELEKRYEFLGTQISDLNESKRQLEHLIERLNKQSREKFAETFEDIRTNFQELFRKLFGGGKADIQLEDAEDILEAGIEILAKPPGKETRSISLLSGGEKSMTAIALLFAVFKSKPSPFCFLDEVDAALDEANNERFNLIIQEFQKNSQFVIITHAKRTMSIVDVLYGVTMQTRGVSKKISVRFDEYDPDEETAAA